VKEISSLSTGIETLFGTIQAPLFVGNLLVVGLFDRLVFWGEVYMVHMSKLAQSVGQFHLHFHFRFYSVIL